jgi:hypothetical protein
MAEPRSIEDIQSDYQNRSDYNLSDAYRELLAMDIGNAAVYQVLSALLTQWHASLGLEPGDARYIADKDEAEWDDEIINRMGTYDPAETVIPRGLGTGRAVIDPKDDITQARLDQEAFPANIYRQFLTTQAAPGLSPAGRDIRAEQFVPAEASFRLGATDPNETFAEFLASGANLMSADERARAFRLRAEESAALGAIPEDERTPGQELQAGLLEQFTNPTTFRLASRPRISKMNPLFRSGFQRVAQSMYDTFQAKNPGASFLEYLGRERGGRLFNF